MARIAVDVDGVLANFSAGALKIASKLHPEIYTPEFEINEWDWFDAHAKEVYAAIENTPNFWCGLPAYTDQVHDLAEFLVKNGSHTVWLVTARAATKGLSVAAQTDFWWKKISRYFRTDIYVGVIDVIHSADKPGLFSLLGIDYSVDDKGETVEACDSLMSQTKHKSFLLNRPWNTGAKVKNRIDNIGEMFSIIEREGK